MNETLALSCTSGAGFVLGAVFFGGLWWTVRKALSSRHVALWLIGGGVLRMGIALAGFFLVADGHWERLLTCLLGFLAARVAVTWLTRVSRARTVVAEVETVRAP
ncbi:MAG TPA: ATP synthase subunit I [Xanthomonadaceae bacterium]|jgi:F1F0 ATPase subunit 2|nr:ATP synthase subunit I [Xanthomonadaceae bacterium]